MKQTIILGLKMRKRVSLPFIENPNTAALGWLMRVHFGRAAVGLSSGMYALPSLPVFVHRTCFDWHDMFYSICEHFSLREISRFQVSMKSFLSKTKLACLFLSEDISGKARMSFFRRRILATNGTLSILLGKIVSFFLHIFFIRFLPDFRFSFF